MEMGKNKIRNRRDFDRGYAAAVANLISLHGPSTEARETFLQNFSSIEELKKIGVSDFDIEQIIKTI